MARGRPRKVREADVRAVAMAQPERRHLPVRYNARGQIITDQRLDQLAGDPLGRLLLASQISRAEYAAGEKYGDVTRRYYVVRGVHDATRKPEPGSGSDLDVTIAKERLKAWENAYKRFEKLHPECFRVVTKVCISQRDPENALELSYLLVGLRALVAYWGLTSEGKSPIKEMLS